ncbi:hypothetical protein FWD20_02980 [Candidatus Saccharibacteria bacterium]|nr:hypothetical protein [Candidatus Saccharibacteria bacterium]
MDEKMAKEILDKVVGAVFGYQNPLTLEQAMQKFAFDRRLPQQVYDSVSGEPTWAASVNPSQFITMENANAQSQDDYWMRDKRPLGGVEDIVAAWAETNFTTTERQIDSVNVAESDQIMKSENVYRSFDLHQCKNMLFCEGGTDCEYIVGGFSSTTSSFCIRVEESQLCTNSFNVIWSAKISNSFFIQDCYDMMDCMFCSHLSGKRYCIANMQFDEAEYKRLKLEVTRWILTS